MRKCAQKNANSFSHQYLEIIIWNPQLDSELLTRSVLFNFLWRWKCNVTFYDDGNALQLHCTTWQSHVTVDDVKYRWCNRIKISLNVTLNIDSPCGYWQPHWVAWHKLLVLSNFQEEIDGPFTPENNPTVNMQEAQGCRMWSRGGLTLTRNTEALVSSALLTHCTSPFWDWRRVPSQDKSSSF